MSDPLQFFTPIVGRMTHGSVTEKRTKDYEGRPIDPENQRYEVGVAFEKQSIWPFMVETIYPYLATALAQDPNAAQRMQNWFSTLDGFSMKITDGDKPNSKGQTNDNTKGCFVFWFQAIELKTVAGPSADALVEIDPSEIKRGYYVQVAGNIKPNEQPGDRAGIYMNGNIVWLRAQGEVIAGGVDASTAFAGAAPGALPTGQAGGLGICLLREADLAEHIRPTGYFNVKARRLKALCQFLREAADGRLEDLAGEATADLRRRLLGVNGVGEETADSILLYALHHPVFVVDAYTRRIFERLELLESGLSYTGIQARFEASLPRDRALFNEYHALIVALGKDYCKPKPRCGGCPLRPQCPAAAET